MGYAASLVSPPAGQVVGVPTKVTDLLPNRLIPFGKDGSYPYVRSIVVADVVSIEPELAKVWSHLEGDDEKPEIVPFESDRAETRTWLIDLAVRERVAGTSPEALVEGKPDGEVVALRFVTTGGPVDVGRFMEEIESLDGAVWFLKTRDGWPDAVEVAWSGRAIARTDASGALSFPFLTKDAADALGASNLTMERLRDLASRPDSLIEELRLGG